MANHENQTPGPLYHLALNHEWEQALVSDTGLYTRSTLGRSLAEVGFIHLSFDHQVQGVADNFYWGRDDVILLTIDPALVNAPIRVENLDGGTIAFPHLYGPLPLSAVSATQWVTTHLDGRLNVVEALWRQV